MFNQKDVMHLVVAKYIDAGQTLAIGSKLSYYTDLTDGEITLVDEDNIVRQSTAASKKIRIAKRSGTNLIYSPYILQGKVKSYKAQAYAAAAQQVDYIGYNGTSGSMDTTSYNDFIIRLLIQDTQSTFGNKQMYKFGGAYKTGDSPTQAEIALTLTLNATYNLDRESEKMIQVDAICNVAVDASYDLTNTATVVKGETKFTVASNLTYNTAAGTLAVGDYIRFAADALNGTLALTDPVYKVTAIDSLTVTVDRPITVASGAWTDAGDGVQVIPSATGLAASWGIKLTGIARTNFRPGVFKYKTQRWSTQLQGFTTATVTNATAASDGAGTYEQVAELEWFCQGNEGKIERLGVPPPVLRADASSSETYNLLTIEYYDDAGSTTVIAPTRQAKQLVIAFAKGYSDTKYEYEVIQALDAFASAAVNGSHSAVVGTIGS